MRNTAASSLTQRSATATLQPVQAVRVPAAMLRFSHFEVRQTSRFVQFSSLPGMSLKKSEVSK
jgi:hypothetical protein